MAGMALRAAVLAVVRIGADEHPSALVVENDLVEIDILRGTQRTGLVEGLPLEGVILEVEAAHVGVRRDRVEALLAAGALLGTALTTPGPADFATPSFGVVTPYASHTRLPSGAVSDVRPSLFT